MKNRTNVIKNVEMVKNFNDVRKMSFFQGKIIKIVSLNSKLRSFKNGKGLFNMLFEINIFILNKKDLRKRLKKSDEIGNTLSLLVHTIDSHKLVILI